MRAAIILVALAGCVHDDLVACEDGRLCPVGTVCWELADPAELLCATPEQLEPCVDAAPFAACTAGTAPGRCYDGVCLEAGCGNARRDPIEACDDGNNAPGDGCSADCASNETCGNGITDPIGSEQCDSGDLYSHDGCTAGCTTESPAWSLVFAEGPEPREAQGMVYDGARSRVVMFGGVQSGFAVRALDDMWEWNGLTWTRVAVAYGPSPRFGHAMAYDASRKRIVLFGGAVPDGSSAGQSEFDETWEWDGTAWSLIPTPVRPPQRVHGQMVYDSQRKRVVLFGGEDTKPLTSIFLDDTWTWNGTKWEPISGAGPGARGGHAMVYDPLRDVVVVAAGGRGVGGLLADTWELEGVTWTRRADLPKARHLAGFAFDPTTRETVMFGGKDSNGNELRDALRFDGQQWNRAVDLTELVSPMLAPDPLRGVLVLFGGSTSGLATSDTYELDTAWHARPPTEQIVGLTEAAATFDPRRGRAVLFGGYDATSVVSGKTYELDGDHWVVRSSIGSPPARYGHAMAFDLERNRTVVFGGQALTSTPFGDTWTWDGGAWTLAASSGPVRVQHALSYDAAHARIVMFGGFDGITVNDETWTWDGVSWTQLHPPLSPPRRQFHAMAYDPIRERVVLYGGEDDFGTMADLWEWDGASWTEISPTGLRPGARQNAALVWNPARRRIVLIDGRSSAATIADAWEWDGTQWSLISTMQIPSARTELVAVPVADGTGIVLSGGVSIGAFGVIHRAETWRLQWSGFRADDLCRDRSDPDADGLAGCDDPDCWYVCTPLCSPGLACATTAPRCGDGVCSSLENCRLCPGDCTCAAACGDFYCDPGETCPGDCP